MIGFCKIEEKKLNNFLPPPSQKIGTGALILTFYFLLHYDNIMKHPTKF